MNDGNATLTTMKVFDDLQKGLVDRLVEVILYYVGTGEEKVVGMFKTDHNGESIIYHLGGGAGRAIKYPGPGARQTSRYLCRQVPHHRLHPE